MNLLRTLAAISSMTMLSRITGLARDTLFAAYFGTSGFADAFNVAFRLPNLFRRLVGEGAFSQAFVPILGEYKNKYGQEAAKNLADHVCTALIWFTIALSLLGVLAAPWLAYSIASGMDGRPAALQASIVMTRMMFPYIACMSFVAMAGGILNTWGKFKVAAFTPVLYNVASIATTVTLAKHLEHPIYAMAIGVMLGGLLQMGIQIPALRKIGMLPRLGMHPFHALRDPGVRRILIKMGPAVFAVSAAQVSLVINTNIASWLGEGAITALSYADRLMEFPTALLGVALGTILLPGLSKASTIGDGEEYSALLNWGLRLTCLLALPASVGIAVLCYPMIATVFHYRAFTAASIQMAAAPLAAYGVSLAGIIMVKILAPAFYARQDVRTPVKIAVGVMIATQVMNLIFVWGMGMGLTGLALSIGCAACLNALFLYRGLRKTGLFTPQTGWLAFFAKLAVALVAMGALAWYGAHQFDWVALQAKPLTRAFWLAAIITACAALYFGILFVLGFRVSDFKRIAR